MPGAGVVSGGARRERLAAVVLTGLLAVSLVACAAPDQPAASPSVRDAVAYAEQLTEETNAVRVDGGLPALQLSACAVDVALDRAADRVAAGDLTHAPMDEVFGACSGYSLAAENLVDSAATPGEVVESWMGSPGHRANIVDPELTEIGIGCVPSDAGLLCSQLFLGEGG